MIQSFSVGVIKVTLQNKYKYSSRWSSKAAQCPNA